MPRNPGTLSVSMQTTLAFLKANFHNKTFTIWDFAYEKSVLHNSYNNTINALIKREYIEVIEINTLGNRRFKLTEKAL